MAQPVGQSNNILDSIFRRNRSGDSGAEGSVGAECFEILLKIFCWAIDQIPYINIMFRNAYLRSMDKLVPKMSNYDVLSAYPCPSYLTAKQGEHLREKTVQQFDALMERMGEAPDYAICYSRLHRVSDDSRCMARLREKVNLFYQGKQEIHLGAPGIKERPTLSPNFIQICQTSIPTLRPQELYIHGPIEEDDREKLKDLIIRMNLVTIHLDVDGDSAIFFTTEAFDILKKSRTITTFNLTLMGDKRELQSETPLLWHSMNLQTRWKINYQNVLPPKGWKSQNLSFH